MTQAQAGFGQLVVGSGAGKSVEFGMRNDRDRESRGRCGGADRLEVYTV